MPINRPPKFPRWADVGGIIVEPTEGKKDVGWLTGEKPPAQYFNWLLNLGYQWEEYADAVKNFFWFGSDSQASAVLDGMNTFPWATRVGTTYTMNNDLYANNLTINVGSTLQTNGYRLNVAGTLTVNGALTNNGSSANLGIGGLAAPYNTIGGGGSGGVGGPSSGGPGINVPVSFGGSGNSGGDATSLGGIAGVATSPTAAQGADGSFLNALSRLRGAMFGTNSPTVSAPFATNWILGGGAGGGGGAADGTSVGGGGGGGAGVILINAQILILGGLGIISASGGRGEDGTGATDKAGGGGGGGGGVLLLNYATFTNLGGVLHVLGGTHGAGINGGNDGNDGISGSVFQQAI